MTQDELNALKEYINAVVKLAIENRGHADNYIELISCDNAWHDLQEAAERAR